MSDQTEEQPTPFERQLRVPMKIYPEMQAQDEELEASDTAAAANGKSDEESEVAEERQQGNAESEEHSLHDQCLATPKFRDDQETAVITLQPTSAPAFSHKKESISIPIDSEGDEEGDAATPCCEKCTSWCCHWSCRCPCDSHEEHKEQVQLMQNEIVEDIISDFRTEMKDDVDTTTCCELFMDKCCQSWSCDLINPCKCSFCGESETELKEKMTSTLRKARSKGWKVFQKIAFPLVKDVVRDTWVSLELVTVIIGIALSCATFSFEHNDSFNILSLVLASISSALALIDGVYVLKDCRSCRDCCGKENSDSNARSMSDILRMIASELLIYPLLICNIIKVTTGKDYEGETHVEKFGFALFIVSCLSLLFYGYVIRIVSVIGILKSVSETRAPSREAQNQHEDADYYGSSICVSASLYQIYFAAHVFLQMLVQMMMIVAIGAKIRYENRHFYEEVSLNANTTNETMENSIPSQDSIIDQSIHISNHLWYMIITGYFLPLVGLFMFFFVTYYWTQEFPIGLYLDMISVWKMGKKEDIIDKKTKQTIQNETAQRVFDKFYEDFELLRDVPFSDKAAYPFKSPTISVICLAYGLLLAAFVICAAVTYDETGALVVHILNGGGWVLYFILACVVGAVANLYVLLVAAVWIMIIILTILFVILVICSVFNKTSDENC